MMESSETAEPQESFPDSAALNDGLDREGEGFQTEVRRARRQLRIKRELRTGAPAE
jgi:hypothetical protein